MNLRKHLSRTFATNEAIAANRERERIAHNEATERDRLRARAEAQAEHDRKASTLTPLPVPFMGLTALSELRRWSHPGFEAAGLNDGRLHESVACTWEQFKAVFPQAKRTTVDGPGYQSFRITATVEVEGWTYTYVNKDSDIRRDHACRWEGCEIVGPALTGTWSEPHTSAYMER